MNKGLQLASGHVVGILNSDDTYAHNQVISRVAMLLETTGADTCYADLQYVRREKPEQVVRYWKAGTYRRESFLRGWMPPHPTFFAKAELYQKYGGFNESFKISADYELMLRLLYRHAATAAYLPEVIVMMKTGGMSNASLHNRIAANREDRMAWKVNDLKPGVLTFQLKPFRKLGQFLKR
jgi:glycosyltransferase